MGLSSQLAPSAIAKPGVVANAAARPASPYDGQVIYQQDTDQAYVWNGSAWVLLSTGTANPPGLELITSCTVTSAGGTAATASGGVVTIGTSNTSVTVSNAFSSSYDNYRILINGGTVSTACDLGLRLGSAVLNYRYQYIYGNLSTTVATDGQTSTDRFGYVGITSTSILQGDISVIAPFGTGLTTVMCHAGRTGNYLGTFTGVQLDSTSFTSFTLLTSAGSMSGGTIRVYGYRNS